MILKLDSAQNAFSAYTSDKLNVIFADSNCFSLQTQSGNKDLICCMPALIHRHKLTLTYVSYEREKTGSYVVCCQLLGGVLASNR